MHGGLACSGAFGWVSKQSNQRGTPRSTDSTQPAGRPQTSAACPAELVRSVNYRGAPPRQPWSRAVSKTTLLTLLMVVIPGPEVRLPALKQYLDSGLTPIFNFLYQQRLRKDAAPTCQLQFSAVTGPLWATLLLSLLPQETPTCPSSAHTVPHSACSSVSHAASFPSGHSVLFSTPRLAHARAPARHTSPGPPPTQTEELLQGQLP